MRQFAPVRTWAPMMAWGPTVVPDNVVKLCESIEGLGLLLDTNNFKPELREAGVERILVPGWHVESSRDGLALVARQPWLDASVGVHPHDAARVDRE